MSFPILSKEIHLLGGLEHVPRDQSKIPIIINHLEHLLNLGFQLKFVIIDREFYRVESFDEVKGMKEKLRRRKIFRYDGTATIYKSWKINQALFKKCPKKQYKSPARSFFQNQDYLKKLFLKLEKTLE